MSTNNKLFTNDELKKKLTAEQYDVCVNKGTERPGTGEYNHHFTEGVYNCVVCGETLFMSDHKFDSGCGWPAFYDANKSKIATECDKSIPGRPRVEITCQKCNSHLGHVFEDGPQPTNLRYCVNSASLKFKDKS